MTQTRCPLDRRCTKDEDGLNVKDKERGQTAAAAKAEDRAPTEAAKPQRVKPQQGALKAKGKAKAKAEPRAPKAKADRDRGARNVLCVRLP